MISLLYLEKKVKRELMVAMPKNNTKILKLKDGYALKTLCGITYLLPYGQNIASFQHGIRLNNTGEFLCRKLYKGCTKDELIQEFAIFCKADKQEIPHFIKDLDSFLLHLNKLHILSEEQPSPPDFYFCIAGIVIGIAGNKALLHPSLFDFSCAPCDSPEQHYTITNALCQKPIGVLLIRTPSLELWRDSSFYTMLFPLQKSLPACRLSLDGKQVYLHLLPEQTSEDLSVSSQLLYAIRDCFLYMAQKKGFFSIHSVSILKDRKAWLLSAPSGTGKSTHAALWHRLFQTSILNGDLNLCRITEQGAFLYGIPWCGTSGIYTTKTYPLQGIIFLEQSAKNQVKELDTVDKILSISQRLISPAWTEELLLKNLAFAEQLSTQIDLFKLYCNMHDSAAMTARQRIDSNKKTVTNCIQ